ncbi:MAG: hypothetical protein Kow0063_16830 [Anaerolineae bacterium]
MKQTSDATLLSRFVRGTIYTSLSTGLGIISGIATTKVLAVFLPSGDFGVALLMELVANFLAMISGFSIGIAAIRALTNAGQEEQTIIVDTVVIFRLVTAILVSVVFFFAQDGVYWLLGEKPVANLAYVIPVFTLVVAYQTLLRQMLQGFFRFRQMALIDLGGSILNLALMVLFLVWLKAGLEGAIYARILGILVTCVLFYLALPTPKGFSFRYHKLVELLRFSWALQLNDILTFIFNSFGTLVVAAVMTPADVAALTIASRIPNNLRRLYEAFRTVYFPNLANLVSSGDKQRAQRMLNATLRLVAFLMTFASVIVMLFQRELVLLFYSEQYLAVAPIFVLMMLSTTIGLIGNVLGNSTVAAGNSKAPAISNIVNTAFTVLGNLTLVPLFGIAGSVWAGIIGRAVTNPLNVWFLRKAGLVARVMDYLKPVLLFSVTYALFLWIQPEALWVRLSLLLTFVVASFVFSVVTFRDIRTILDNLERLWGDRLRKRAAPLEMTTRG